MRATALVALSSLALAVFLLAAPPMAQACSGGSPRGYVGSRQVFPVDGATAVPTNARIVVSYSGGGDRPDRVPIEEHMVLAAADGSVVPIIVSQPATSPGYAIQTTFVLAPVEPLQPNTQYIVYSAFATVPCVQNDYWNSQLTLYYHLCTPVPDGGAVDAGAVDAGAVDAGAFGAPAAISAFTTGDGPDLTSPVLSGGITTAAEPQSCSASPCCGPFDGFSVTLQWTEATDNGPVLYELSREGVTVLYPLYPGDGNPGVGEVQGAFLCSGSKTTSMVMSTGNPSAEAFQGQPGRYQVVAVDQAGNRSAPIGAKVNVDCGGGCSCRLAARRDGCAGFALVGLALAIGVRRKRSRSVCLPSSTARR